MSLRKKCRFRAQLCSWLLIVFISTALPNPVVAANRFLEEGIQKYNAGDYSEAIGLFGAAEGSEFNNAILHYYMADALVRTNHKEDAIKEYNLALSLEPKGQMADYCKKALHSLCGAPAVVEAPPPKVAVSAALLSKLMQSSRPQKDELWRNEQLSALETERKAKIRELETSAERDINAVNDQAAQDKESLRLSTPSYIPARYGMGEPNPVFQAAMGRIEDDAVSKVNDVNLRLKRQVEEVNRFYEQRESSFKTSALNVEKVEDTPIRPTSLRVGGQSVANIPSINTVLGRLPLVNLQDYRGRAMRTVFVRMASDGTWEADGEGRRLWKEELVADKELRSAWQDWLRQVASEALAKVRDVVDFKLNAAVDLVISRNGEIYKIKAFGGTDGPDGSAVGSEPTEKLIEALKSSSMPAFPSSSKQHYARVFIFVTHRTEQWWHS